MRLFFLPVWSKCVEELFISLLSTCTLFGGMIMFRKIFFSAILSSVAAPGAHAAVLKNVSGAVLVNKGDGFWEARGDVAVSSGDRVLVRESGSAQIDYGNGCLVAVAANQSVVVGADGCELAFTGSLKDAPTVSSFNEGASVVPVLIVGGIVTGSAGAAVASGVDDNDRYARVPAPASP